MKINNIGTVSTDSNPGVETRFPVGTRVIVPNWPTGGKVMGHHEGSVIVEVLPISYCPSQLQLDYGQ